MKSTSWWPTLQKWKDRHLLVLLVCMCLGSRTIKRGSIVEGCGNSNTCTKTKFAPTKPSYSWSERAPYFKLLQKLRGAKYTVWDTPEYPSWRPHVQSSFFLLLWKVLVLWKMLFGRSLRSQHASRRRRPPRRNGRSLSASSSVANGMLHNNGHVSAWCLARRPNTIPLV
jgi:hypothetical protein